MQTLALQLDAAGRHRTLDTLRSLQLKLETPHDTLSRYSGLHLEITAARIAQDLEIFTSLSEATEPLTAGQLAGKKNASSLLVSRILRYLASVGTIHEAGPDAFTANAVTRTLSEPGYRGGISHFFDNCGPVFQASPSPTISNSHRRHGLTRLWRALAGGHYRLDDDVVVGIARAHTERVAWAFEPGWPQSRPHTHVSTSAPGFHHPGCVEVSAE